MYKHFDFQGYAHLWSHEQFRRLKKHFSIAKLKSSKFTRKVIQHDWQSEAKKVEHIYYVNKAVMYGASSNLPFKTLYLLGQLLSEKPVQKEIKEIIKNNVLKHQGLYFKLDDHDNQNKIRKILRTYQFEKMDHLHAA